MKKRAGNFPWFNRAGTARGDTHCTGAARGVWPLLITGIAVILFSSAGVARMLGWGPNLTEDFSNIAALENSATSESGAGSRCPECGFVVSVREIDTQGEFSGLGAVDAADEYERLKSTRSYEINVSLADGSSRLITVADPANWRAGERLIVIAGTDPSQP